MTYSLEGLNEEQKEAVTTTEGYVRVIAGAGSGKTRALTHRYAYLVEELGINPGNICCVTFTNKAANEMKQRIRKMIGDQDTGLICTFHGLCVRILRDDANKTYYPNNFLIIDEEDQTTILKNVYKELNLAANDMNFKQALISIRTAKFGGGYIEALLANPDMSEEELTKRQNESESTALKIFYGYIREQRKNYGLDFDDLILFTLYIFQHFPDVLEKWQKRIEYMMVDEFQDISDRQAGLLQISDYHKNLFVVGDPDQTIYSWRGASVGLILDFDKKYPNVKTIDMNRNYRSDPSVLSVANSLIKKNEVRYKRDLLPIKKSNNTPVIYQHAKTVEDEAKWIADKIKLLQKHNVSLGDIAILYRAHYVSRSIEEGLMKEQIPYVIHSGISFYARREIKDSLSYLRMLIHTDDLSFLRTINTPRRNIGEKRIAFLKEYANKHHLKLYDALKENLGIDLFTSTGALGYVNLIEKFRKNYQEKTISDLFAEILSESGYEAMLRQEGDDERLDNLAELKQSIVSYENTAGEETSLEDYLGRIALYTNTDRKKQESSVVLMTIHSAKGLEFPYVFVCGMNEGIFPSRRVRNKPELEEERRLAYVAFTRAEEALFITEAEGYSPYTGFRYPSRFIFDIDKKHLNYETELEKRLIDESSQFIQRETDKIEGRTENLKLKEGDVVEHLHWGKGKIIKVEDNKEAVLVQFDNTETPRSIRLDSRLERVETSKDKKSPERIGYNN